VEEDWSQLQPISLILSKPKTRIDLRGEVRRKRVLRKIKMLRGAMYIRKQRFSWTNSADL
jgi:hypothetical protein